MKCQKCEGKLKVLETRIRDGMPWRLRECRSCGYRFSTQEVFVEERPLLSEEERMEALREGHRLYWEKQDKLKAKKVVSARAAMARLTQGARP